MNARTQTKERPKAAPPATKMDATGQEVAVFQKPRLPWHPAIEDQFGVDKGRWKALVEAVFPAAKSVDSVVMALSYCKARNLDPMKRVVHIVPVYDSLQRKMVETVWPGIAELRTTAFRTGSYAGRDRAVFGPMIEREFTHKDDEGKVTTAKVSYPEWCQITVYRMVQGQRVPFPGPEVYWEEAYATQTRWTDMPNAMWRKRPRGQLDKCAEAAALRAAFPEEIGGEYAAEEMSGKVINEDGTPVHQPAQPAAAAPKASSRLDALADAEEAKKAAQQPPHDPETGEIHEAEYEEVDEGELQREAGQEQDRPSEPQPAAGETAEDFGKVPVPRVNGGRTPDLIAWAQTVEAKLQRVPDVATLAAFMQANKPTLDSYGQFDETGLQHLMRLAEETRARLSAEVV